MDLDLAYDVGQRTYEAAKATTIDQSATETAAYGIGLVGGVIGGFGGEITSERERSRRFWHRRSVQLFWERCSLWIALRSNC
jgi:hypothetical protein